MKNDLISNININLITDFVMNYNKNLKKLEKVDLDISNSGTYISNCIKFLLEENSNISEKQKYSSDNRSIPKLLANILVNGWLIEDTIIKNFKKYNLKVEKNGSDSDRTIKQKDFNSNPDLIINGKKVEVQCFSYLDIILKENKLNTCINQNSHILLFNTYTNKYCLLYPNDISNIVNNYKLETIYSYKTGYIIPSKDFSFVSFDKIVELLS